MSERIHQPVIVVDGVSYTRIPVKTRVVMRDDKLVDIIDEFAADQLKPNDTVFISEKVVAITQGRAIPLHDIKPRKLATFLSRFVTKTPAGKGLGLPEMMEMAMREVGVPRILLATFCSALTKPFGIRGVFHQIVGYKAKSIDDPAEWGVPPYNECVILSPDKPDQVAREISSELNRRKGFQADGIRVAVVDINDLGGFILGISHDSMDRELLAKILKDNPLGQAREQTPFGILRNA